MLIQLPRTLHTVLDFTLVPALLVSGLSLTAVVHLCTYFWIRPPFSLKRHLIVNIARVGLTIGDLSVFPGLGVVPQRDAREQTVLSNWYTKSPDTDVDVRIIEPLSKDVPRLEIIERVKGKVGEAPVPGFMVAPAVRTVFLHPRAREAADCSRAQPSGPAQPPASAWCCTSSGAAT